MDVRIDDITIIIISLKININYNNHLYKIKYISFPNLVCLYFIISKINVN